MKKLFFAAAVAVITCLMYTTAYAQPRPRPLEGRIIILDAGHGAGADNVYRGYSEAGRMLVLSHMIYDQLTAQGATVHLIRPTAANVPLAARAATTNRIALEFLRDARYREGNHAQVNEINRQIALLNRIIHNPARYGPRYMNVPFDWDLNTAIHPELRRIFQTQNDPLIRDNVLFISLHSNASPSGAARGADIYYSTNTNPRNRQYFDGYSHVDNTWIFSNTLLNHIAAVGIPRRNITPGHWLVIREVNVPAVLVENGFHTNAHERGLLSSDYFLRRLSVAYLDAITAYFDYVAPRPVIIYEPEPEYIPEPEPEPEPMEAPPFTIGLNLGEPQPEPPTEPTEPAAPTLNIPIPPAPNAP